MKKKTKLVKPDHNIYKVIKLKVLNLPKLLGFC